MTTPEKARKPENLGMKRPKDPESEKTGMESGERGPRSRLPLKAYWPRNERNTEEVWKTAGDVEEVDTRPTNTYRSPQGKEPPCRGLRARYQW